MEDNQENINENKKPVYKDKKLVWAVFLIVIIAGAHFVARNTEKNPSIETISAKFLCKDNRFINATFNNSGEGSVLLSLSDGRKIDLPRAISASGARYANTDESFVFWNKGDTAFIEEKGGITFVDCVVMNNNRDKDKKAGLPNPASAKCLELGGTLETRSNMKGQYGVCIFEDNRQCEEWALFRGKCPAGGLKITGYENEAQIYCAITGGKVEGVGTNSVLCKRVDGTYCQVEANLNGDCPNPNDPNPSAGNREAP